MSIKSIVLKNWMNISEANLTFIDGINIIQGNVGEGKSAVFAAIAFALSGYKRGDTWKDYIKTGEDSFDINLVYAFSEGESNEARISISGKINASSINKELKYRSEVYKNSEADIFLSSHLDLDMMNKVIFNLQGSQPLALMTPAERRDIFKKIFNSDFTDILTKVKLDKEEAQTYINNITAEMNVLKNKKYEYFRIIDVDESELLELKRELNAANITESLQLKLNQHLDKINQLNQAHNSITKEQAFLDTQNKNVDAYAESKIRLEAELSAHKQEQEGIITELKTAKVNKEEVDIQYDEYKKLSILNDAKINLDKYNAGLIETKTKIALNTHYLEVHKTGKCESCGQDCDISKVELYSHEIDSLNDTLKGIVEHVSSVKKTIEDYNQKLNQIHDSVIAADNAVSKLDFTFRNKASIIVNLEEKINQIVMVSLPQAIQNLNKAMDTINRLNLTIKEYEEWLELNPKPDIDKHRAISDIQNAIDSIQNRIQTNIVQMHLNEKSKSDKIKDEGSIITMNLDLNKHESNINNLNSVISIFTTDFPSFINMRACKILESFMNNFFSTTKNKFEVALQNDKKGIAFYYKSNLEPEWRNLKMVSGFESALSSLGFNVSVSRAFGSDLILLDEPEANADIKTAERLFETIVSIGGFKQMFIITHKPEVLPLLFDNGAKGYEVKGGEFTALVY